MSWGNPEYGGDSSGIAATDKIATIYSNFISFAAVKRDRSVVSWGDITAGATVGVDFSGVAAQLSSDVATIVSNHRAHAAAKSGPCDNSNSFCQITDGTEGACVSLVP